MAIVAVKYTCGCKFSTASIEAAVRHSNERKHTLTAYGLIRPEPGTVQETRELQGKPPATAQFSSMRDALAKATNGGEK